MNSMHIFEKLLFCLREENMGIDEIRKLPGAIGLPIIEVIRFCKFNVDEVQTVGQWPESLYKLIQREDIYLNLRTSGQFS